jgi:hypothetical protein
MPPLDDIAKAGSKTFDRALSLVAALIRRDHNRCPLLI